MILTANAMTTKPNQLQQLYKNNFSAGNGGFSPVRNNKSDSNLLNKIIDNRCENIAERFRSNNADLLRSIERMSDKEKFDVAVYQYKHMQELCYRAVSREENSINEFSDLKAEKAYYTELLNTDGDIRITDGRYAFALVENGTLVSKDDVISALSKVQGTIDRRVSPNDNPLNDIFKGIFNGAARMFEAATGITSPFLNVDGDNSFLSHKADRTEENFIEKAKETIRSVTYRSKGMEAMMKEYLKTQGKFVYENTCNIQMKDSLRMVEYYRRQIDTINAVLPSNSHLG